MAQALQEETTKENGSSKKNFVKSIRIGLIIIIAAGALIYFLTKQFLPQDNSIVHVSGRIEGYETNVGAKIPGRVNFIAVREGDLVKVGEIIVRLSDDDIQAQLRGAKFRFGKAKQARDQAIVQIQVINSQIDEAKLNLKQAREDTDGRIRQADANVAAARAQWSEAQAQLAQAQAELELVKIRKDRYNRLADKGAVTIDQSDQANTNYESGLATVNAKEATVRATKKQLIASEGALTQARTSRMNPDIRASQLAVFKEQLEQAHSQLDAAELEIRNSKAAVDEIAANIAYLNIPSPIDGVVTARAVEPGAVVTAGQTVLSLINLQTVYLRAYIPEGQVGKIRVGQKAKVYLDSAPNKGVDATLIEIDPMASFTPENIYFRDDRVKQVFGLKIGITQPGGFAKPGMPADADILLTGH